MKITEWENKSDIMARQIQNCAQCYRTTTLYTHNTISAARRGIIRWSCKRQLAMSHCDSRKLSIARDTLDGLQHLLPCSEECKAHCEMHSTFDRVINNWGCGEIFNNKFSILEDFFSLIYKIVYMRNYKTICGDLLSTTFDYTFARCCCIVHV